MELGENLKEHFSKITFYGLHAGNNQNSIWKPHSNFAFPEPYIDNNNLYYKLHLTWHVIKFVRFLFVFTIYKLLVSI